MTLRPPTSLLTPTMMLDVLKTKPVGSPEVERVLKIIIKQHGQRASHHIEELLAVLPEDRARSLREIAGTIHASRIQNKA